MNNFWTEYWQKKSFISNLHFFGNLNYFVEFFCVDDKFLTHRKCQPQSFQMFWSPNRCFNFYFLKWHFEFLRWIRENPANFNLPLRSILEHQGYTRSCRIVHPPPPSWKKIPCFHEGGGGWIIQLRPKMFF